MVMRVVEADSAEGASMTDTATLRSLADEIDAMRHQIRQRDATIIRLRAERDTLRRENALLRSGIDPDVAVAEFLALGMNLRAVPEQVARDMAQQAWRQTA